MTGPNTEGSSSESLESFVGDMFGDLDDGSSEPGPAAGTPPTTPAPASPASAPEGTAPTVAPTGTPPADAAAPPPDSSAAVPATGEPDLPTTPATYTVDGVTKTYEGIRLLGEDGAIIAKADLPDVLTRLGERDRLVGVNQTQYQAAKQIEPLTTWITTKPDGTTSTLSGPQGLIELRVDHARQEAILATLEAVMMDPTQLLDLLGKNEAGEIVVDPKAWKMLLFEAKDRAMDAMASKRTELGTVQAEAAKPAPVPINYAAEAPAIITAAAGAGYSSLTPEDHAFLSGQLEAYTRGTVVHANYAALVQNTIAQRQALAKTGQVVTSAAATNAARLAAAARGIKPSAPAAPVTPITPTRANDSDSAWDLMQGLAGKRLRTG